MSHREIRHHILNPRQQRWVTAEAKRRRCSKSYVIRELIEAEIEKERRAKSEAK